MLLDRCNEFGVIRQSTDPHGARKRHRMASMMRVLRFELRYTKGRRCVVAIDHVEMAFRARMLALAHKGGAVTKRRYGNNPRYYRDIGRLGGLASVAARKARLAFELDGGRGEAPMVEALAAPSPAPQAPPRPALSTLKQLMATQGKPSAYRPYTSRSDDFAEQQVARIMAQMNHPEDENWDEPFDELD